MSMKPSAAFALLVLALLGYHAEAQAPPTSNSGCSFDPVCWYYAPGCTLGRCAPFNRSTPVTCNQCLQMCNEKQAGEFPFFCRAIAYDCATKTCDMFGVDELGGGYLIKDPNKFYFKPSGQCRAANVTSAPAPSACPSGQVAKMVRVKDSQFPGMTGQTASGVDEAGCAQACVKNQLPDGTAIDCKSAQFKGGQCTLATTTATAEDQIQPDPGSAYFQKFCFDAGSVAGCPDVFDEYPQKALIGQNRQALDATSLQECVQECLNAKQKYGFGCNSALFYFNVKTQNCLLNDETKTTKPDLFTDIKEDKVTYVETLCGGTPQPAPSTEATLGTLSTLSPLITTLGPGVVTSSGSITEQTTRLIGGPIGGGLSTLGGGLPTLGTLSPIRLFQKKKEVFDKPFRDLPSDAVCRAMVYNGAKRCPIGVVAQGSRLRYCANPVDC